MENLKLNINNILRYLYPGILILFLTKLLLSEKTVLNSFKSLEIFLLALSIGAITYAIFRPIGEIIIFPSERIIHGFFNKGCGLFLKEEQISCSCTFLRKEFNVDRINQVNAYRAIRDKIFDSRLREQYHLQHSEIYLLYLSSFIFLIFAIIISDGIFQISSKWLFIISGIMLFAGLISDINLCRQECTHLKSIDNDKIKEILKEIKFIN